jgi:hypothetical protein
MTEKFYYAALESKKMVFLKKIVDKILDSNFIIFEDLDQVVRFKRVEEIDLISASSLALGMLSPHENISASLHSLRSVLERSIKNKTRVTLLWHFCVTKKKLSLLNLIYVSLILYFKQTNDVRFLGLLIKLNEIFLVPYNVMLIVRFFGLSSFNVRTFIMLYRLADENSCHFT